MNKDTETENSSAVDSENFGETNDILNMVIISWLLDMSYVNFNYLWTGVYIYSLYLLCVKSWLRYYLIVHINISEFHCDISIPA